MKGTSVFCPKAKEAVLLSFTAKHTTCDSHFLSLIRSKTCKRFENKQKSTAPSLPDWRSRNEIFDRGTFFFQWSFIVVAFGNVRKIIDWLMFFIIVHEVRFWIYLGFNPIINLLLGLELSSACICTKSKLQVLCPAEKLFLFLLLLFC